MIPWLTDQFNHRELDAAAEALAAAAKVLAAAAKVLAAVTGSVDIGSSDTGIHTFQCYPLSVREQAGYFFGMLRADCSTDYLLIVSVVSNNEMKAEDVLAQFEGTRFSAGARSCLLCPASQANYTALSGIFPWIKPSPTGKNTSFGTGDRLGLASPGHIAAFRNSGTVPILAQQSKRELQLTGRSYGEVIRSAGWAVFASGFTRPWGADGDHLKYAEDIADALEQGCTMITADLSEHLFFNTSAMSAGEKAAAYEALDPRYRKRIEKEYSGIIRVDPELTLEFNREVLTDIALTYYAAVEHAARLYREAERQMDGSTFDFEISIDETDAPTSPEAHYFTARELEHMGIVFTSLAPRFVGEFQKGIDYIGNRETFSRDFSRHAIIAGALGYKISVHSSSDKFSVYPSIAKRARGPYHVKTSGTNWLTALEVIALEDPEFFRELLTFAYTVYGTASSYYHVTPDLHLAADTSLLKDSELLRVFENPTDRQVLHIAYGEIFSRPSLKHRLYTLLETHIMRYWDRLAAHIGKHLALLNFSLKRADLGLYQAKRTGRNRVCCK